MFSHPFVRRGGSAVKAALPLVLLAGFPVCPAHAQNTLIEAESRPQPGDAVVVNDPAASGGKAVSIPRDWQPLFSSPVPAGDRFTIWMRHKGGPLELKASMPDGQKELQWVWDQPTAWEWSKFGTYASSNLGTGVIIIRGGGGAPGPELDCVLFATDPNFDPNATPVTALAPPAAAPAAPLAGAAAPFPGTLIEAESRPQPGDAAMVDDPAASGGKAVSIPRDWQPLFSSPVPAGDHFTIWMRHKGGPLELKAALPDGQKELQWVWDQPTAWEWSKFGTYAAADLGTGVIIIRGGGGAPGPELDCVLFATDPNFDPTVTTVTNVAGPSTAAAPTAPIATAATTTTGGTAAAAANLNEGAAVALGMQDRPTGQLFEAENYKPGSDSRIVQEPGASGGEAVTSDADWQPLLSLPLPGGDAWRVWVRHKGGPFAIKTTLDGKPRDRWFWEKPDTWTWTETDVFSRDDLGGTALTIGRDGGGAKPDEMQLDCVVLSPETKRPLPADKPDPALPPLKVAASVAWDQAQGAFSPRLWGINEHELLNPDAAADPTFQQLLGALHAPLIRIHHGGLVNDWTDSATRDWNVDKIRAGFSASSSYGNAQIILCLDGWPSWLSDQSVLEPEKVPEFAKLCAHLVGILRDQVKRPIAYWEITNEQDNAYEKAGRLPELWSLYNAVAAAMRAQDPQIKLGGPALTWAKPDWVSGFLANCPDVQFLSWHNYGTGDLYESNASLFANADTNVGALARGAVALVKSGANGRTIETFLDETNVKYTWDPYERRHQNQVGSIFQALVVMAAADAGLSGVALWQERGAAYGSLIDDKDQIFPSYQLYRWGTTYLFGKRVAVSTADSSSLRLLAVIRRDGTRSLLLLNLAPRTVVTSPIGMLLPGTVRCENLSAKGYDPSWPPENGELRLPGYSLTLLSNSGS